jgi:predicted nuclease of predicted toxin-antitoxin system
MKFMVDECVGTGVAKWLRNQGFKVFSVYEEARGATDDELIEKACLEGWILITNDKDFGTKVYRERKPHKGIILLRLTDDRSKQKIIVLEKLIKEYSDKLPGSFVVVTDKRARFAYLKDTL